MKGKADKPKKPAKPAAPSELVLRLHDPGMTPMHRAGLGGLAATLAALERHRKRGLIAPADIPGGDWTDDADKPWQVEPDRLTLKFGTPDGAGDYLRKLFAFGFRIKDKLIDLPGTYREELSRAVRAELQLGLTLTFLQHGKAKNRKFGTPTIEMFDFDGSGSASVAIDVRPCESYPHQIFHEGLTDQNGNWSGKDREINGTVLPGAGTPYNNGDKRNHRDSAATFMCSSFAMVGCLSLPVNKGVGVLIIPLFDDLTKLADMRSRMTPTNLSACRVAGSGDAALQAAVRVRSKMMSFRHQLPSVLAVLMRPTPWAKRLKTRVRALTVPPFDADDDALRKFDLALRHLPRKVRSKVKRETIGRGRKAEKVERPEWFFTESVVRPLIADNLARGRPWYDGFADLMHGLDDNKRQKHRLVAYETTNLNAMIREPGMTETDELKLIETIHRAVHMRMGAIYADTMGRTAAKAKRPATPAVKNRWSGFKDKTRLSLVNAKTQDQTREAISLLLARAGEIRELKDREALEMVHRLVFSEDWRRARDLALFALASYRKPQDAAEVPGEADAEERDESPIPTQGADE